MSNKELKRPYEKFNPDLILVNKRTFTDMIEQLEASQQDVFVEHTQNIIELAKNYIENEQYIFYNNQVDLLLKDSNSDLCKALNTPFIPTHPENFIKVKDKYISKD